GGNLAQAIGEVVSQACADTAQQIEQQVADRAHAVLDIIAKQKQPPHVANQVHPTAVQEHAGEQRPPRSRVVAQAGWYESVLVDELLQLILGKLQLQEEHQAVDQDDQPRDHGDAARHNRIFE